MGLKKAASITGFYMKSALLAALYGLLLLYVMTINEAILKEHLVGFIGNLIFLFMMCSIYYRMKETDEEEFPIFGFTMLKHPVYYSLLGGIMGGVGMAVLNAYSQAPLIPWHMSVIPGAMISFAFAYRYYYKREITRSEYEKHFQQCLNKEDHPNAQA